MDGIVFENVTKAFDNKVILENTSFNINKGITLFISENGTGKSTMIYCISGSYNVSNGNILVNGYNPVKRHRQALENVSIMPEAPSYFGSGTISEHIELFSKLRDISKYKIFQYLDYFGMPEIKSRSIGSLSMGEAQIIYISCYLAGNYKIYIFDEPNSNLDRENRKKFAEAVSEKYINNGSMFIITSHIDDELSNYADNILTIKNSKIMNYSSRNDYGYIVSIIDKKNIMGKLNDLDYFFYKNFVVIKNATMLKIVNALGEDNIIEIKRISSSMVSFYENGN